MKRTTVKLPDELDAKLRLEAKRRGMTVSELVREAIEAHLDGRPRRRFYSMGVGRGGGESIAARVEEILDEEWTREVLVEGKDL
jgi:Arc/MetJ-type ribon-helix-helix transcriptional regulator